MCGSLLESRPVGETVKYQSASPVWKNQLNNDTIVAIKNINHKKVDGCEKLV